jgi:hypothetical protein
MKKNLILSLFAVALVGCAAGPTNFVADYHTAMNERPGVALENNERGLEWAGKFIELYSDLSPASVEARVKETYAANVWFNDTIATKVGISAVAAYLLRTAQDTPEVRATIDDVAVSGSDCYVRWTMHVRTPNLAGGKPIVTSGISQLRFDREGRIILHQDYWNPAAGIYQHLPVIGLVLRYIDALIVGAK